VKSSFLLMKCTNEQSHLKHLFGNHWHRETSKEHMLLESNGSDSLNFLREVQAFSEELLSRSTSEGTQEAFYQMEAARLEVVQTTCCLTPQAGTTQCPRQLQTQHLSCSETIPSTWISPFIDSALATRQRTANSYTGDGFDKRLI
jgi:hypothetical protein